MQSLIRAPRLEAWPQRPEANKTFVDHAIAVRYYCERLETLADYAGKTSNELRSLFLTHEELIHSTGSVFAALQRFLGVSGEFSERYDVLRTTGVAGYGDVSQNIKLGYVNRAPRESVTIDPQSMESIDPQSMERAQTAFDRCCGTLRKHCSVVTQTDQNAGNAS